MKPIAISLLFLSAGLLRAEIQTQEKDQVQFPGMLGRMMNLFGGKSMREGTIDTVAVKGNRKITVNDTTGRIIDLDEEKVYDLDMKAKKYKVMTFEELRRQMEETQQRAKNEQQKTQPSANPKSEPNDANAKQMQIDFDLKDTGQKKNINGFDCREVVMTITVHEKEKTLEQSGGMVMTTHEWLAPRIAAMKEITDFDSRYAEKLRGPSFAIMPSADQMAAAAAMYPMLTDAIGKFNVENVNMDGTAIQTVMTAESVASAEQIQQQQQQQNTSKSDSSTTEIPTSVGSLIGGIGRRAARNRAQQQQQQQNNAPGHATIMTVNHEVMRVATDVSAADVAIPAGFKQK
jgi:hypothetical protein